VINQRKKPMNTHPLAVRRLIHVAEIVAALTATAMVSIILHAAIFAEAPPRETTCWSDPMSGLAPLTCGEFAGMVMPEVGAATWP